jgi:hypothetical protein
MILLDNLTGLIEPPDEAEAQMRNYGEEVLCAEWNPALTELRLCLLSVAESEERRH